MMLLAILAVYLFSVACVLLVLMCKAYRDYQKYLAGLQDYERFSVDEPWLLEKALYDINHLPAILSWYCLPGLMVIMFVVACCEQI